MMKWQDIRESFPEQWVLIEALKAHTDDKQERILEDIALIRSFPNSSIAMKEYRELHQDNPSRELYVLHTNREHPNIIEKKWAGVRKN